MAETKQTYSAGIKVMFTLQDIAFALQRKSYQTGAYVHTQERLWRRDFYDGTKLRPADIESGASHSG